MARRSDHNRDELKNLILKTSWDIIEKNGSSSLTARKIASEIGYAAGTIYNIFGSMDDLYLNINAMTLDKLYKELSTSIPMQPVGKSTSDIKKMANIYRKFVKKNKQHWLMLFNHSLPNEIEYPEWYQQKINLMFEPLEKLLEPFYNESGNHIHRMSARILWSSVHGICFLEETGKAPLINNQETSMNMTDYLIDNFIAGINR